MPILNRETFNSERNRLTVNSLFLECVILFEYHAKICVAGKKKHIAVPAKLLTILTINMADIT